MFCKCTVKELFAYRQALVLNPDNKNLCVIAPLR